MKDDEADDNEGGEKKEEEYDDDDDIDDFRAPPGLSHARPRRGLLRDGVWRFGRRQLRYDDDDDDEENLDRFFSPLPTVLGKGFLEVSLARGERAHPVIHDLDVGVFTPLRGLAVFKNDVRGKRGTVRHREGLRGDTR